MKNDKENTTTITILTTVLTVGGAVFASYLTGRAQINSARITKENVIQYDYKEVASWNVSESTNYFPLEKGNYWIYQGDYHGDSATYLEDYKKQIEFKIEVLDVIKQGDLTLYIVSNYFDNLIGQLHDIYDNYPREELENKEGITIEQKTSGLFSVANKIFFVPPDQLNSFKYALLNPEEQDENGIFYTPELNYDLLRFEFPLFKGQRFGDFESITRNDMSHFWYVNEQRDMKMLNNSTFEDVKVFSLIYNTLPDCRELVFRPSIGIISYKSNHNGSPDNIELKLQKYHFSEEDIKTN